MELTEAQAAHFDAFGFLKLRAFSDGEVRAMVAEAEAADPACSDPVERSELLTALMVTRLLPAMRRLLGEGFVWSGSECNISRGERQAGGQQNLGTPLPAEYRRALGLGSRYAEHTWHADRPGVGECAYDRIKVMAYLTPTDADSGALRVIAGSHRAELHGRLEPLQRCHAAVNADGLRLSSADPEWAARTGFGLGGTELPCTVLSVTPGELIIFHHSLFHGIYYHYDGRTVVAAKFAARPTDIAHHASNMRCALAAACGAPALCAPPVPALPVL